jgi:hypothetical protein
MADDIDLNEDDGWVNVKTEGGGSVRLDLFRTHSAICDYHAKNKGRPDEEYADGLVQMMMSLGLPQCSHRLATRFVEMVGARVEAVKKKDGSLPGSPGSTGSTPSA